MSDINCHQTENIYHQQVDRRYFISQKDDFGRYMHKGSRDSQQTDMSDRRSSLLLVGQQNINTYFFALGGSCPILWPLAR